MREKEMNLRIDFQKMLYGSYESSPILSFEKGEAGRAFPRLHFRVSIFRMT
jgi:hypothetical protein